MCVFVFSCIGSVVFVSSWITDLKKMFTWLNSSETCPWDLVLLYDMMIACRNLLSLNVWLFVWATVERDSEWMFTAIPALATSCFEHLRFRDVNWYHKVSYRSVVSRLYKLPVFLYLTQFLTRLSQPLDYWALKCGLAECIYLKCPETYQCILLYIILWCMNTVCCIFGWMCTL